MTTKLPPRPAPAPPAPGLQVPYMVAYHDVDGAHHQQRFNQLVGQGYRILSCSIYGDPASPRYAFVWVNRSGPAWQAIHGVDQAAFQSWFDHWTHLGYYPTLVSTCGSAADPRFTAVLEQVGGGILRYGLRSGDPALATTLEHQNQWAVQNGWILGSLAVYGGAADRRYAATWSPNPAKTFWRAHVNETATTYQADFDAETQIPFRPSWVSRASDGSYASVFCGDSVGDWVARHELTSAQYQTEFNAQVAAGRIPISVQGGGSGSATRFAAVFARHDQVQARQWTVTGQSVPQLAAFDHALQQFMQANGVRAGQLAIGRGGAVRYARAYTWAEPGYATTSPDSVMRLASCSKMFTEGAIQVLFDRKKLQPATKVYPTLGLSHPQDARADSITVQQLLDHTGGYDRAVANWDPVFDMRSIALALGLNRPVTKAELVSFVYKQRRLQHDPGTQNAYSNYGYLLLGYLVEKVSGQAFGDFVRGQLLAPLGIGNVWVSATTRAGRRPDEVSYDDPNLGGSAVQPTSSALVPLCYGGEGWLTEVMDSGGGLCTNASALVRYVAHHPVWGNGDFRGLGERDGSMAGVSSMTVCRNDGLDWAVIFNTRAWPATSTVSLTQLHQSLDALFATTPIP